jgi:trans-aconitate methyltransferase
LPENSNVLEIGSGPGSDWEILNRYYNIVGSDNSEAFLNHLSKRHPKGEFINLDASILETDRKFDAIYSNKVLHHLTDQELENSIKRQRYLLNEKGVICHSFWKGEGTETYKGLFVNYHNAEGLTGLFTPLFEIISITDYKEFEQGDSILLIARKK